MKAAVEVDAAVLLSVLDTGVVFELVVASWSDSSPSPDPKPELRVLRKLETEGSVVRAAEVKVVVADGSASFGTDEDVEPDGELWVVDESVVVVWWSPPWWMNHTVVGSSLGSWLGSWLGSSLGSWLGSTLGSTLGTLLGSSLGSSLGSTLGTLLGSSLGSSLGSTLGTLLGSSLGNSLGKSLGSSPDSSLGSSVTASLGSEGGCWDAWTVAFLLGDSVGKTWLTRKPSVTASRKTSSSALAGIGVTAETKQRWKKPTGHVKCLPTGSDTSGEESYRAFFVKCYKVVSCGLMCFAPESCINLCCGCGGKR